MPHEDASLASYHPRLIGQSEGIQRVYGLVARLAPTDWSVLLEGETGTGKTALASEIHRMSQRSSRSFVVLDCAALPETLLESELFGYEKGTFTGAYQSRAGQFEAADGGTLFLDEIGNLSPSAQSKLLTVLQERRIRRLGGKDVQVDVRVLAATNRHLDELVRQGLFRSDLYHRLSTFVVTLPPLRERSTDIPVLFNHFLREAFDSLCKPVPAIPGELVGELQRFPWPGNIRELQNLCKRIALLAEDPINPAEILATLLNPASISNLAGFFSARDCRQEEEREPPVRHRAGNFEEECVKSLREIAESIPWQEGSLPQIVRTLTQFAEREIIQSALSRANGNKAEAARMLKINYKTLYCKIRDLRIAEL